MDNVSRQQRSRIMAKVKGTATRPELAVRSALKKLGIKFSSHQKDLPGRPDIVIPYLRTVIFVHGCFWHGHTCKDATLPRSNRRYWREKIGKNSMRDRRVQRELRAFGWHCYSIWTCRLARDLNRVTRALGRLNEPT